MLLIDDRSFELIWKAMDAFVVFRQAAVPPQPSLDRVLRPTQILVLTLSANSCVATYARPTVSVLKTEVTTSSFTQHQRIQNHDVYSDEARRLFLEQRREEIFLQQQQHKLHTHMTELEARFLIRMAGMLLIYARSFRHKQNATKCLDSESQRGVCCRDICKAVI